MFQILIALADELDKCDEKDAANIVDNLIKKATIKDDVEWIGSDMDKLYDVLKSNRHIMEQEISLWRASVNEVKYMANTALEALQFEPPAINVVQERLEIILEYCEKALREKYRSDRASKLMEY